MLVLVAVLLVSLGLSLLLTPIARRVALRINLVDRPDGRRKIHAQAIPVAGGLAVLMAMASTLTLFWLLPAPWSLDLTSEEGPLTGLLAGGIAIAALGVADDFGRLRGRHKLLGQVLVAALVTFFGVQVHCVRLFGWDIDLGPLSFPFTVFLLLGAINSLNLLDGMDGMLGSVGLIMSLAITAIAALTGHWLAACLTVALAGALLGFLRYNLPPASIYLGDAGSMLIGLVIGVLAIRSSLKGPATVVLAAPLGLLAIPVFDTTAAILRRTLTGRSIYCTDRGHLHHCLLRQGWGTRRTLLVVSCLCLITAAGALASVALNYELLALPSILAVVVILVAGRLFGHAELALAVERLKGFGSSLVDFRPRGKARGYEIHLQGSAEWQSLWTALNAYNEELNLKAVRLDINAPALHESYHAHWTHPADEADGVEGSWRAEMPLVVRGQVVGRIHVTGRRDGLPIWEKIAALAKLGEDCEVRAALLTERVIDQHSACALPGPHLGGFDRATVVPMAPEK
jgi:UDP-GlcNAc:undecaprenyl-phosphate/decaprenyl-phosphate GlcNAc-1-phosphate transferase